MKQTMHKVHSLIPRNSLAWLLTAQVVVLLPHLPRLPVWVSALWLGCALWRIQIQRMRWGYPGPVFKTLGIVAITAGVWLTERTLIGLDAAVMLLLLLFMFKLLEMRNPRDAVVVVYLGFFIIATAFLFDQSIVLALYQIFSLLVLIAALVGLQQTAGRNDPSRALRTGSVLLLQAVPLMVVLFLFFPRIGPLWSVATPGGSATTGLAESMAPGDIADLARSGALAFRVQFEDDIPAHDALYWRSLTLASFDGRSWNQLDFASRTEPRDWKPRGEPITYQVTTKATQQPWVFSLRGATSEDERLVLTRDFMLRALRPLSETTSYQATSYPRSLLEPQGLNPMQQRLYTLLPEGGDPRSRAFAAKLRREYADDAELVEAMLQYFNQQPFFYTLRPDTLGVNTNDEFLFDTRRGFCAHFAGAMALVLRAAGVPARIVAGYQGGEVNPAGNYVLVHQFDAHAWVEVWLPGQGWVSVDPTFQVAPERIERGIQQALQAEGSFLEDSPLSAARYRNVSWINTARLQWDEINFQWQLRVLGFQSDRQLGLFQRWLGTTDWQRIGLVVLACIALVMVPLALWTLRPGRSPRDPRRRAWARLDQRLLRLGLQAGRGEGPRAWQRRLTSALPGSRLELDAFFDEYVRQTYASPNDPPDRAMQARLRTLERDLRRCLPRKPPRGAIRSLDADDLPQDPTRL